MDFEIQYTLKFGLHNYQDIDIILCLEIQCRR